MGGFTNNTVERDTMRHILEELRDLNKTLKEIKECLQQLTKKSA
jgi:hypothetical protein